jgi:hypothetical protein
MPLSRSQLVPDEEDGLHASLIGEEEGAGESLLGPSSSEIGVNIEDNYRNSGGGGSGNGGNLRCKFHFVKKNKCMWNLTLKGHDCILFAGEDRDLASALGVDRHALYEEMIRMQQELGNSPPPPELELPEVPEAPEY